MPSPPITFVIPAYGQWPRTRACLESIAAHVPADQCEVVLVDDCSPDGTVQEASLLGPVLFGERFALLTSEKNRGFATAVNRGARHARGTQLFLLNNDTLLTSNPIPPCLDLLESDPDLAGVGPMLVYADGPDARIQHLGVAVAYGLKCVHLYALFPASHPVARRRRRLQVITAAALCMDRELFLAHGGLHEGFINGMEDIDLCARLAHAGYHFAVSPDAVVVHAEHASSGRFDKEAANDALLHRRAAGLLAPDMAALAAKDGYVLRLTPWLDPHLLPAPERLATLDAAATAEPDAIFLRLEDEPCWPLGYDRLEAAFRNNRDWSRALAAAVRRSAFLPSLDAFHAILELAQKAGDASRAEEASRRIHEIRRRLARPERLRETARNAMFQAREAEDAGLAGALRIWFAEASGTSRPDYGR
ncbi:glycosyltransferase family 2 protein [Oceanidesulfovibrio indonesiensis]|uniref:Glycosyltransferase family 2 protein n=2 Tax=Oceanidesulfovibrio indonesiensis TaxID=54767 RepID=A0A7M3MK09_9BACT|nr:glycosyltransferase family 2 protein [Oceanidesulfovibrio indonesiensis]